MKPETILQADILDIIFEKRNKSYGAYTLRKHYHERLYKALAITFFTITLLCLYLFFKKNKIERDTRIFVDTIMASVTPDATQTSPPEQPIKPNQQTAVPLHPRQDMNNDNSKNIVFSNDPDKIKPINDDPSIQGPPTPPTPGGVGTGGGPFQTPGPPTPPAPPKPMIDPSVPVSNPDVMPSYPGGMEALKKFLEKNLKNPTEMNAEETITVRVKFIVGYDGMLKGFEVLQDGGEEFNQEVIRVLKKMPAWIPGKAHGENVSVMYSLPVVFMVN